MASDAIVVGEDWISEHYFTTDATKESFKARVLGRRSNWDALKEHGTPRTRFTAARTGLLNRFATLDTADEDGVEQVRSLNADLRALLGYEELGQVRTTQGPVTFVHAAGLEHTPGLAIIDAQPSETVEGLLAKDADNLAEPFVPSTADTADAGDAAVAKDAVTSVARLLSLLFVHDDYKPAFALVLAGPHVLVAERERWPEGRYLAVDLQLVAERNDDKKGGEVDRALTCLAADSLAPDPQGDIWWSATLAESVKHTVGVSKDLREGVRLSIEIIANEVVARRKATGLDPLPAAEAQPLAKQSLRFLYRILFLLYAEASPELGVLPAGAPEYENGYSLDRLRELVLVDLPTQRAQAGTHLYESLAALYRLVDQGHDPRPTSVEPAETSAEYVDGLTFRSLRADLFKPEATAHVDEVGLGNAALQRVLRHLLLSKEQKGRDRGFISYAELGINQLGAVYEGLMSYTGFFAETDLYEVAKDGDAEKGSWVVPVSRAEGLAEKDFVMTEDVHGQPVPVLHQQGSFVFRLAGRERQQSASYYTPEVLTRFVVSQALEELLDQDGKRTTAAEVLGLTICEPALGSGAFAIEAVRQLAEQYLVRRQEELGETIDPDAYPREMQRVKAYLALHQVHGVDLNATAVELAEISLWLDTMVEGLEAPWFGLHLRRGNSLIGARKAVYSRAQVEDKSWLNTVPKPVKPGNPADDHVDKIDGRIPHFLLPAEGWGAGSDVAKDIKELVPDAVAKLKKWRRSTQAKPTKKQTEALVGLGRRVERLWEIAGQRLAIAEQQIRREIPLWNGNGLSPTEEDAPRPSRDQQDRIVAREEIEATLADPDGAYRRLKLIMDAWCALWFWPLTEDEVEPPNLEQWYDALLMLLGVDTMTPKVAKKGDDTLQSALTWDELGDVEHNDRVYADAKPLAEVLARHSWLQRVRTITAQQGFFHWDLDFAAVFDRGGFDLQVGNPPWVRPDFDERAALGEFDVRFPLNDHVAIDPAVRTATFAAAARVDSYVAEAVNVMAIRAAVSSPTRFPSLVGLRPDLYRCFIELGWKNASEAGVIGLIHLESHFTDENAGPLRRRCYRSLRRHWQFINELKLFEIQNQKRYGVNIYGRESGDVRFLMAASLYHPETVARSLNHDGSGVEPGIKDDVGEWDLRPHSQRIFVVDETVLRSWHEVIEDPASSQGWNATRMVYAVNSSANEVLRNMVLVRQKMADLDLLYGLGLNETNESRGGCLKISWGAPSDWRDVVLQGSHLYVGNPFNKYPNPTLRNHRDWHPVDLHSLAPSAVPVTKYKPRGGSSAVEAAFPKWLVAGREVSGRDHYRIAWRSMAAPTGERTLMPAVIPPGTAFVTQSVYSLGATSNARLLDVGAQLSSLLSDYLVRAVPKSSIPRSIIWRVPFVDDATILAELRLRFARLNCLTDAYAKLWEDIFEIGFASTDWAPNQFGRLPERLCWATREWEPSVGLRFQVSRRQALLEIDVLTALGRGLSVDHLCAVYRTQFPVLVAKDMGRDKEKFIFDVSGRLVPNAVVDAWKKSGLVETSTDGLSLEERTHTNASGNTYTYELPFRTLDREADMRTAYAHFEKVLAERAETA